MRSLVANWAIRALSRAVGIDKNNASLYGDLGAALHAAGHVADASDAFRRGLRLDAQNASLYYNLGNVLREQESLERSESCYRAAIRLEPKHAYAHNNLGLVLEAGHRYDEARDCYRRALSLDRAPMEYRGKRWCAHHLQILLMNRSVRCILSTNGA